MKPSFQTGLTCLSYTKSVYLLIHAVLIASDPEAVRIQPQGLQKKAPHQTGLPLNCRLSALKASRLLLVMARPNLRPQISSSFARPQVSARLDRTLSNYVKRRCSYLISLPAGSCKRIQIMRHNCKAQ
jgi:hypothetical protein